MMAKDKGFSWVIALACCFINCLLYGVTRLSGLLLVSTVDTFQVARATAAIPFSVSTSVRNLSGIFVGYLGQKCGLRLVISTGCLLASLGAGLCFFATDVFWITVFWGGMFGIGCGFATCLLPLAINGHFEKHRGTALGISYSGAYIGSFIFPPILVQLIDNYGLPGAFLVISASLLNGLAASLLFGTSPSKANEHQNTRSSVFEEKQILDKVSPQRENSVSKSCYKRLWYKLLYHFQKLRCLLKSKELSGANVEVPIHLKSSVALKDPDDIEGVFVKASSITEPHKISEGKHDSSVVLTSYFKKTENRHFKYRPEDFYLHCKTSTFKSKSTLEYKNKIAKLRKMRLVNFFKKRYCFNTNSKLPVQDVKLVSIKSVDGSFYATIIRNDSQAKTSLFEINCHEFVTDKPVCNIATEKTLSDCEYKKKIKRSICDETLESQITNAKTEFDSFKTPIEFSTNKLNFNDHYNSKTEDISTDYLSNQPHFRRKFNEEFSNCKTPLESLELHVEFYSNKTTCNSNCLHSQYYRTSEHKCNNNFNRFDGNENLQKRCLCLDLNSRTASVAPYQTKKNSLTTERDSNIEGTCSLKIYRHEQHHVSYSPSGTESNIIEDSTPNSSPTNSLKLNCHSKSIIEDSESKSCSKRTLLDKCLQTSHQKPPHVLYSPSDSIPESKNQEDYKPSSCTTNDLKHISSNTDILEDYDSRSCSKKTSPGKNLGIELPIVKDTAKCCFSWFRMYGDPMFLVITTTMSLHTFVVVCMITIIEDFAKDLHVAENRVHCVLMALSIADLLGALTLGVITDRRYMSGCCFVVLCFFGTGVCILAISQSRTLAALLALVSCYGIFETGVVITLPLLIAQLIEGKKQAVALAASNILSSPTVMLVPLVIGYFRDHIGCYSGVFYVLAITSFCSSLIWLVAPFLIHKYRSSRERNSQC